MSKILFICEKPSQAKDIASNLGAKQQGEGLIAGSDVIVTWCLGHLLEQAPPEAYCQSIKPWRMEILPIIPHHWKLQPKPSTKKQLAIVKKLIQSTKHVVIATDADREGEVIAREVLAYCHYEGKIERLWLSALDDRSIQKALSEIRDGQSTEGLYHAGIGRARADWLIGMNLTMATTHLFSQYGESVLSVGRVQTPTLKLVVDRDQQIEQFQPQNYFTITAQFQWHEETFKAKWQPQADDADDEGRCLNKDYALSILNKIEKKRAHIVLFSETLQKQKAPLCFSLSSLQQLMSSKKGFSAKKTLAVAQSLYEKHKAITYPRTDCAYLPQSQFEAARDLIDMIAANHPDLKASALGCDPTFRSQIWNDKKITAHHAIIPTNNKHVSIDRMTCDERAVYQVICQYYLAQFLGDHAYQQRQAELVCENERFQSTTDRPEQIGWKQIFSEEDEMSKLSHSVNDLSHLPVMMKGDLVDHTLSTFAEKKTTPPSRLTEGTLITAMKSIAKHVEDPSLKKTLKDRAGIGTEATRANIIDILIKRGYLAVKKKHLISTSKGRRLISLLPDIIKDPETTARWEQMLDEIACCNGGLDHFLSDQIELLETMLSQLSELKQHQSDQPC